MKKQYEKPSVEKVSFQQTENIADIEGGSIGQGGGYWGPTNETEEGYQNG